MSTANPKSVKALASSPSEPRAATIGSLASELGFGDLSYFNRSFRRVYGMTPSDVRANSKNLRPN